MTDYGNLRPREREGQSVEVRSSEVGTTVLEVAHANETALKASRVVAKVTIRSRKSKERSVDSQRVGDGGQVDDLLICAIEVKPAGT